MYIPTTIQRSTYSYAIAPLLDGGVFSPLGYFSFMLIMAVSDLFVSHKAVPILIALIILTAFHKLTKDREPGEMTHAVSLVLGEFAKNVKYDFGLFRWILEGNAEVRRTLPPPTLKNHYER